MDQQLCFGLPRMHLEPGEKRDFLPGLIARLHKNGAEILLEHGYGSGMGLQEEDYREVAPDVRFADRRQVYQQDYVLVLRCPQDHELRSMRPGACLLSMVHYPTRPKRVDLLQSLGLEAISLDSLKDDSGRRLVENLRAVAWNGVETAFQLLRKIYPAPGFDSPTRLPITVTLLGAGAVGMNVVQAAIWYGNNDLRKQLVRKNVPGVQVITVDYDLTGREGLMRDLLSRTDILVDATQRPDPTNPVISNDWLGSLPSHAVILDLSVDPYDCENNHVKGIEGIPQGNLDQYTFAPDDPAYNEIPDCFSKENRRYTVSCYSWPGIHPAECMDVYGRQLLPILRVLIERGGVQNINPQGHFFDRAIVRAQLSRWQG